MKTLIPHSNRTNRAQGMLEFALVLPILLLLVYGVIEAGRMLFIYSAIATASREAARYGSAAGNLGPEHIGHFQDCNGIRAAALRLGSLAGLQPGNIEIRYDGGPDTTIFGNCPVNGTGPASVRGGNRIRISISSNFNPIVPLVNIPAFPIQSFSARTIVKDVKLGDANSGIPGGTPYVNFTSPGQWIDENDPVGKVYVVAQLSIPTTLDVIVPFTVSGTANGSAPYADYSISASGQVVIPAGSTMATIEIQIVDDDLNESDETIVVSMDTPLNATRVDPYVHTTTILDNDGAPVVSFTQETQSSSEAGGTRTITVELNTISGQDVVVPLLIDAAQTTATMGSDYEFTGTSVVIPAYSISANAYLTIVDDPIDEEDEVVFIAMGTPVNAGIGSPSTHTVWIIDNDAPPVVRFQVDSQSTSENLGELHITVQMNYASSKQVIVPFSVDLAASTATLNEDYTISASPLVIPAGATTGDIIVFTLVDTLVEPDETVVINLGTPTNATLGSPSMHTLTILGTDALPKVSFEIARQTVSEGAGSVLLTVRTDVVWPQDITVPLVIDPASTATSGQDYTVEAMTIVIPARNVQNSFRIYIVDDSLDEVAETIVARLGQPTNAGLGIITMHTVTITDNDGFPTVYFTSSGQRRDESSGTVTVTVQLNTPSGMPVSVPFRLDSIYTTATPGADFNILTASPVVIPAGAISAPIAVAIVDDNIINEGDEVVALKLDPPTNAQLGAPDTHKITIIDNDFLVCPTAQTLIPNGNKLYLTLYNTKPGAQEVILTDLTLYWPDRGGNKLLTISLGSAQVWQATGNAGHTSPTTVTGGQWIPGANRTLYTAPPDNVKTLTFQFNFTLTSSDRFILTLKFNNGCFWSSQ